MMIVDSVGNVGLYKGLGGRIARALALLGQTDFRAMEPGKQEVDGTKLFYMVQAYQTKPREKGAWESHRKYIDVQYVVDGIERMGWAPFSQLSVTKPYSADNDAALYSGDGDFIVARAGTFLVLWPDDAHMPGIAVADPVQVRKVVVKILI
jgi:YhcH/YjgK/YiaL family protein